MAKRERREHEGLLRWLRAAGIAGATFAGLYWMQFRPTTGALLVAVVAGALSLVSVDLGIVAAVLALAVPIIAINPVIGLAFAVLGFLGERYLGADGGRVFLLVAAAIAGAFFGPAWAAIPIAGYLLGSGEGGVAAAVACLAVEATGLLLGADAPLNGVTINGGTVALLDFSASPATFLSSEWIPGSLGGINSDSVQSALAGVTSLDHVAAMAMQPAIWAAAAAITAVLVQAAHRRDNPLLVVAGVTVGALVPAAGSVAVHAVAGIEQSWGALAVAAVSSLAIAAVFAAIYERVFALVPAPIAPPERSVGSSIADEDADVDELLRLVATAEEKLTTQHTTNKFVMITDMKSFSRMTEEDGSIVTAKAIQKHRDLLLPIIESKGGCGKSTGGDGLVAAFDSAQAALEAAAEMQRALASDNAAHPARRETAVRIGIADGEVVLDKAGRPFIGAALNVAARVMNLADGGQAFTTARVAKAGGRTRTHSHGKFELKNIAEPVEIVEVLWGDAQAPKDPRMREPGGQ